MKKIMHICFAFVLVLSAILLTTGIGVPKVAAEGINGLTDIDVSYLDAANNPQNGIKDDTTRILMNYKFYFDNTGSNGQTVEFTLPSTVFKQPDAMPETPIKDANGVDLGLGTQQVDENGKITLKFKPNLQDVEAEVFVETWIDPEYVFESSKQTITLANEHTFELSAAFANRDKKEGEALKNQNRIKWTLDVNTELKTLQDVTITDTLPEHLTLDSATLKVNKLNVSENSVTAGDAVNVANAGSNTDLSLNLGNITGAYRITFETIIDASILSKDFTNTAQFNGKAISSNIVKYDNLVTVAKKNLTATGKVPGNKTGDEITISPDNRQQWEIYVNDVADRKLIKQGTKLSDELSFSSGQNSWRARYVDGTLRAYRKQATGEFQLINLSDYFTIEEQPTSSMQGTNDFEFIFVYKGADTTDAFKFTYETEDSATSLHYGNKDSKSTIRNTAKLYLPIPNGSETITVISNEATSYYVYNREISLSDDKEFYKNFSDLDYENQLITTQFVVRVPGGNTKQIAIRDWSGSRLLLTEVLPENIVVKKYPLDTEIALKENSNGYKYYEINREDSAATTLLKTQYFTKEEPERDDKGYEIPGTIATNRMQYHLYPEGTNVATESGLYVIEIVTPFNADLDKARTSKDLHNNAYVLENGNSASRYASPTHEFTNNPFMMKNGFKDATYDLENRKITWEVGFNYNVRSLEGAVITDTIEGNHNFDLTTFTLKKWYVDVPFEGNKKDKEYTSDTEDIAVTEAEWKELINLTETGFTLNMDDLITKKGIDPMGRYILTYETTMKDDLIDKASYKNDFKINYLNDKEDLKESIITGTAEVPRGGEHVSKDGLTVGRNATWNLDVNAAQSIVDNIEIIDTLSENQVLDAQSIQVFEATVEEEIDTNGKKTYPLKPGKEISEGSEAGQYTYKVDGNTLKLTINGVIEKPYIVTYKSFVFAANGEALQNNVSVSGKQLMNLSEGTSHAYNKAFVLVGATATAKGSIIVKKTDSVTGEPLKGVVFKAEFSVDTEDPDAPGEQTYTVSAITDENGIATFSRLPYGEVEVYEAETIVGYILNSEPKTVTVGTEVQELAFENDPKINASVTLTKIDSFKKDLKLAGAEFKLQRKDTDGTYKNVNKKGDWLAAGATPITFTTSDQESMLGTIYLNELKLGDYQFVEVQAPIGYKFGTEQSYTFTLNADNTEETLTVENSKVCSAFEITVQQGGTPLADGTKIVLVDKDGTKIDGTIENGKASFTDLPEGNYTIKDEAGKTTYGEVTVSYAEDCVEIVDANPTCDMFEVIVKADGEFVANEEITIVSTTDETITFTVTTDENGKATFPKVTEGEYKVIGTNDVVYGTITVDETTCEEGVTVEGKTPGPVCEHKFIPVPELPEGSVVVIDGKEVPGTEIPMDTPPGTYPVKDEEGKDIGEITVPETTEENPCPEGTFTPASPTCEEAFIKVPELPEGSVVVIDGKEVPGTEIPMDTPPGTYPVKDEEGKDIGEIKVPETTEENPCPEGTFTPASPTCEEAFIKVPELPEGSVVIIDGKEVPGTEIPMDTPPGTYPVKDEEGKDIGEIKVPETTEENPCPEGTFTPASNMCSDFEVTVTVDGNTLTPGTIVVLVNEDGVKFQESVDDAGIANFKQLAEGKYIVTNEAGDVTYTTEKLTVDYELGCKDTVSYESPKAEVCEQFTMNITEDGMPVAPGTLIVLTTDAGSRVAEFVGEDGKVVFKDLQNGTYTITNQTTGVTYDDPITVDRTVNCETTVTHISPPAPVCDKEFVPTPQLPPGSTITINGEKVPVDKIPLTTTPGNYTVTDDKDKEIGELTITPGTPENPCPVTTFTEKEPPTGSVILTKIDRADAQKALQGATFKLQIKQNGTYVDFGNVLTTNDNGQISAMDLPLGEYQFVEILAPAGYVLAAEPWTFAITEEQLSVIINAANDKEPLPPGQLAITKVDAETNAFLADAEFTLVSENNQESTKVTTGADGQVIITDLPVGNYTLTETKAPAGYVLDDKPIVVKISSGETFKVVVKNTQVPPPNGSLEVTKLEQGTNTLLVGAEFVVSNGSIEYKVGATNANGTSILNNLPPGEYTLTETKAPNGYVLDQQPVKFTIESDKTTRVTMYNVKQAGNFKLTKVDAATNARLAGAVFQISNGTTTIPFETNASGEAVVTNLAAGSYIVTEISPPSGYVLNSVPKVVTIEAGKTTELTFTNIAVVVPPPPVGTVEVTKIDATTKGALAGAEFTLYNDQQSYKVGPTNGSGIATVQNVQPGVYRLVEDKAPTGYVATNRETIVTVTANGTARVIVENTRAVVNGEFKIIKVDNANRSLRLAGAKFELSNGVTTITLETNANGEAIARNVEAGNYTVREIVAPTGYVLDPQVTTVQIRANEMTELTATNVAQQKVGTFMLVKVDATNASKRLAGAAFELSNGVNTYTLITNATGQATVANIPAGTYTLKEVIAPAGYRLNMELASVTIQDNATFTFTALNSPLPSGGNIGGGGDPNTDGSGNNNGGNPDPSSPTPGTGGNTGGGGNTSTPGTGGNTGGGGNNSTPGTGGNTGGGGNTSTPGTGGNTGGGGNTSTPGTGGNTGGGGNTSTPGTGGNTGGGGNTSTPGTGGNTGGGNTSTPGTGGNTGGGTNSNITTGGGSSSTGGGSISTPNSGGSTTGTVTTTRPGTTTSSTAGGTTTYYPSTTTTTKPAVTTTALPSGTTTTTTTATLPQTNVQSTAMLTVAGALLVLIAAIVMYRRRKLS